MNKRTTDDTISSPSAEANRDMVLSKCNYFCDVQLWPLHNRLDPNRWLTNFEEKELQYAIPLLNSFIYYSEPLVDAMFKSAFHTLSEFVLNPEESFGVQQSTWRAFVDSVIVTYVTGEEPSAADSGYLFARKARDVVGIREEQILSPEQAMERILSHGVRPVVFVDDFMGSGNQFLETWQRSIELGSGTPYSFERLSSLRGSKFYYCPTVCTHRSYERVKRCCPKVVVNPAHVLTEEYNALAPKSRVWPDNLLPDALNFMREVARRSGMPDTDGHDVDDWQGFDKLGLAVAFAHSVPDATLPIFHWDKNGWIPLIRKARQS